MRHPPGYITPRGHKEQAKELRCACGRVALRYAYQKRRVVGWCRKCYTGPTSIVAT